MHLCESAYEARGRTRLTCYEPGNADETDTLNPGRDNRAELFITVVVDGLIKSRTAAVKALPTHETWFGVTYRKDMLIARRQGCSDGSRAC